MKEYKIKNGDTLKSISMEFYGFSNAWIFIWFENRKLIKDPNLIIPDQIIIIP